MTPTDLPDWADDRPPQVDTIPMRDVADLQVGDRVHCYGLVCVVLAIRPTEEGRHEIDVMIDRPDPTISPTKERPTP